jgi:hypothetical protein
MIDKPGTGGNIITRNACKDLGRLKSLPFVKQKLILMWDENEAQRRSPSCDINHGTFAEPVQGQEEKPLLATDGREVPKEKVEAMKVYARELRIKYPKWKQHRINRKVGEKFHVKIVQSK